MKILQIAPPWIDVPPKEYGGTEQVINNLVHGLQILGHQVTLFATKKSSDTSAGDYVFTKSLVDQGYPWEAALPPLLHYHQAFKLAPEYDVVHAHLSSQTDIMVLPFLADLADQHIPAVLTIHGHLPYDRYSNMDQLYLKYYGAKIRVINISKAMARVSPAPFKKAGIVYNSFNTKQFSYTKKPGTYLTWVGKINPNKNPHEAILIAKEAGIPFIFGGVVDRYNPESVQYFQTKVKPLIDNKMVKFVGALDRKKKNALLKEALGFLNPLRWEEPFGMVMLESMAAGTPVIAYSRGAAPELIVDGVTGFLVKNRRQMLTKIPELPKLQRQDSRTHVETHFSPVHAARQHLDIYEPIIRQYTSPPIKIGSQPISPLLARLSLGSSHH